VTIAGSNFEPGATIKFGDTSARSVVFVSSTLLHASVPPGTRGTHVNVIVRNPDGRRAQLTNGFRYGKVLFQDGFESGSFSAWDFFWSPANSWVQSSIVHSGGNAAQIHYALSAVSRFLNRDNNNSFDKYFASSNGYPNGLTHFFVRGYIYLQVPAYGADRAAQRKLYYALERSSPAHWSYILTSFDMQLALAPQPARDSAYRPSDYAISWNLHALQPNTWYSIEMETQLNSPCGHDGSVNVWVDGQPVLHRTGMNIRGCFTDGVGSIEIGKQLNANILGALSEYRYWDDIVISDAYVGP